MDLENKKEGPSTAESKSSSNTFLLTTTRHRYRHPTRRRVRYIPRSKRRKRRDTRTLSYRCYAFPIVQPAFGMPLSLHTIQGRSLPTNKVPKPAPSGPAGGHEWT